MIRIGQRRQRTLAATAEVGGTGFITGAKIRLRFRPAGANYGIKFLRTDLPRATPIPACETRVTGTQRRTTLGAAPNQVTLVEHALAALAGMKIDNALIEIDGAEPPGLDGSARGFVDAINRAGIEVQEATRVRWTVRRPIVLREGNATLSIFPATDDELKISYTLDYGAFSPIVPQTHTEYITPTTFQHELASCRTFLLESEAQELLKQGVGRHLTASELLVFGSRGPIDNKARFADEPARHKILDIIGDLALSGADIVGNVVAYRSGHPLNVKLASEMGRKIREQSSTETMCRRAA